MDMIMQADGFVPDSKDDRERLQDAGFRWGDRGTHTSRTIMLNELRALLANSPPEAERKDYL